MAKKKVSKKKATRKIDKPKVTKKFLTAFREFKRKQAEDFSKRFPR